MDIQTLLTQVQKYNPEADRTRVQRAYELACAAHASQKRGTGEPYIMHCLATASILAELYMDEDTIIAGLLHDVPEDTPVPLETIREQFGDDVAKLVDGVTKLSQLRLGMEQAEAESLRKMFLAMAEEIRVVLIKLADRLHNMRTLYGLDPVKQKKIARETMEIFAPLANRLGIYNIRRELEDLSLKYLEPEKFKEIDALLAGDKDDQPAYIQQAITVLSERLAQEHITPIKISSRPKHIYSIFTKMQRKSRDFDQIYDVRAIRVIVENVRDCYLVLGIVHSLWTPIPGEFDDFIAKPKDNMYQSLHTAVIGPAGKPLEVQIRTAEMHRIAEYGIATHWRYKEPGAKLDPALEGKIIWLRQVMEWRQEIMDASAFVDSLKTDVFQDQVYVFTPKGKIIEMAAGATPIDFAYHVHTEIGNRCRGAKVNGRIVPLDYRVHTGDRVEILTAKKGGPSRDWLNPSLGLVHTARAKEKIRYWFKHQARAEAIAEGRELLEKELHKLGLHQRNLEEIAKFFNFKSVDDFCEAIGHEDVSLTTIGIKLLEAERTKTETPVQAPAPPPPPRKLPEATITVEGVGNLLQRLARCCNPLPGEEVVGFITRGRGITVHRRDCRNILNMDGSEGRLIRVDLRQSDQGAYPVVVRVEAFDRSGLMHDISGIVVAENVNMLSASAVGGKDRVAVITATLEISTADQLTRILNKIERLPNVIEARRVTS